MATRDVTINKGSGSLGMTIQRNVISKVTPNSAAAKAGLQVGDRILSVVVDGASQDTVGMSQIQLTALIKKAGKVIEMSVSAGDAPPEAPSTPQRTRAAVHYDYESKEQQDGSQAAPAAAAAAAATSAEPAKSPAKQEPTPAPQQPASPAVQASASLPVPKAREPEPEKPAQADPPASPQQPPAPQPAATTSPAKAAAEPAVPSSPVVAQPGTCHKCKQAISGNFLFAGEFSFHKDCFTCNACSTSLAGQPFTLEDNHPICQGCWGKQKGLTCHGCGEAIQPDATGRVAYKSVQDANYHHQCFVCHDCKKPFEQGAYPVEGHVYCHEHALQRLQ